MTLVYLVQHGYKEALPGDPGLTAAGEQRAARTGRWLRQAGLRALYASPLRRAQQRAALIAAETGLPVRTDARLRERMNWDGSRQLEDFLAEWAWSTADRDFVTSDGESSRQAGDRLRGSWPDCPPGSPRPPRSATAASPPTCCATCCPTRRCPPA
jgi:broad specificity phosphatase PhoE